MSRLSELPSSFYITGGTLPPDSPSYISRAADDELFQRCLAGEFCYVLTSRQMGKSSLMAHTAERLRKDADTTVAIVDLSQIGTEKDEENKSADRWYYGVARMIQRSLGFEHDLKAWWREREDLPSVQRLTEFFTDVVLRHASGRVLIFVDEIDTTIGLPYSDDFFAAIRACYNARATEPELRRLGFVLLGVASPSNLIADVRRTPFNIGHRIELTDFTFEEAMPLAQALATAEAERARQLRCILHWTGGHPYLTQRICELLAKPGPFERSDEQIDCAVASAFFDPGANRDEPNLRFVRDRLTNYGRPRRDLLRLYERIHRGEVVEDVPISPTHSALKLSGAVVATAEGTLRVRNEIYRHLFTAEWARRAMPSSRKLAALAAISLVGWVVTLPAGFILLKSKTPQSELPWPFDAIFIFLLFIAPLIAGCSGATIRALLPGQEGMTAGGSVLGAAAGAIASLLYVGANLLISGASGGSPNNFPLLLFGVGFGFIAGFTFNSVFKKLTSSGVSFLEHKSSPLIAIVEWAQRPMPSGRKLAALPAISLVGWVVTLLAGFILLKSKTPQGELPWPFDAIFIFLLFIAPLIAGCSGATIRALLPRHEGMTARSSVPGAAAGAIASLLFVGANLLISGASGGSPNNFPLLLFGVGFGFIAGFTFDSVFKKLESVNAHSSRMTR